MSKINFPAGAGGGGGLTDAIIEIEGVDGPIVNLVEGSGIFIDVDVGSDTITIHASPTGGGGAGVTTLNSLSGIMDLVGSSGIQILTSGTNTIVIDQDLNHANLINLDADDHIQYLLRSDFAASGAAEKPTTSGTVVGAGTALYVSGISVGDFLSPHTVDTSGIGRIEASGIEITPTTLRFFGSGAVVVAASSPDTLIISGVTPIFTHASGAQLSDHGQLDGLVDDDHTQYLLRSDFASSGAANKPVTSGVDVGAGNQLWVSGVPVGDFLSPHTIDTSGIGRISDDSDAEITPTDLAIIGSGGILTSVSGANTLALTINAETFLPFASGAEVRQDHGILDGLTDDDHAQYVLLDGDRAANSGTTAISGTYKAISGVFDEQVTISGIDVGNFLSAHTIDTSGLGRIIGSGSPTEITPSDLNILGSGTVAVLIQDADTIVISGIPFTDTVDGSGVGRITDDAGNEITPTNLSIIGSGGILTAVSGADAISITINDETFLPFSSGAQLSDHGLLIGLGDDDHTQYVLLDGDRPNNSGTTSISGIYKAISGVFDSQVTISGIGVGDFLSAHTVDTSGVGRIADDIGNEITPSDLIIQGSGGIQTLTSGTDAITVYLPEDIFLPFASGVQLSDHGNLIGLGDDDHTQYVLLDGDRASNSGTTSISGTYKAISGVFHEQVTISGVLVGDRLYTEAEVTALAEAFVEGGTADPASGVNIGAATQVYVSGVAVGDFLSSHTVDTSGIGRIIGSGSPLEITPSELNLLGSGTVAVLIQDSDTIVISGIAGGGVADGSGIGTVLIGSGGGISPSELTLVGGSGMLLELQTPDTVVFHIMESGGGGGGVTTLNGLSGILTLLGSSGIQINTSGTDSIIIDQSNNPFHSGLDNLGESGQQWLTAYAISGHFESGVKISGISVGDFLSSHTIDTSGVGRISDDANNEITPTDLVIIGSGGILTSVSGADSIALTINDDTFLPFASGAEVRQDHGALDGLTDDDHTQYVLLDGDRPSNSGTTSISGIYKAISGVFDSQVTISGVDVGDFLSAHTIDTSGIGRVSDDDNDEITPTDLTIIGSGGIVTNASGAGAIAIQIPENTFLPFSSGALLNDHSALINLAADDHTQYLLMDGTRTNIGLTAMSGRFQAISGIFDDEIQLSGIVIGDRLQTEADITALAEAFVEGGTADPASGVNVGAATEMYISGIAVGEFLKSDGNIDHGSLGGLGDDDHTQYVLLDGDRPNNSGTTSISGIYKAISGVFDEQVTISGIAVGDRLYTEAEVTSLAEIFVEGGTADPASGVNVGAATQMYISGVAVGDFLAAAAGADGSGIGRIIGSGSPVEITPSDLTILGSGSVAVLIQDADTIVVSGIIGGGAADGSGVGRISDDTNNEITPTDLAIIGSGGILTAVSGTDAISLTINDDTFLPFASGAEVRQDHGILDGLTDDDHTQYLLMDGTRTDVGLTAMSGRFQSISGIFDDSLTISGVEIGDFLSAHTIPVDARPATGNIDPTTDSAFTLGGSGLRWTTFGAIEAHIQVEILPNDSGTASVGNTSKPFDEVYAHSGIFNENVSISGIDVGDFLSTAGAADGSGIGRISDDDNDEITPTDLAIIGSGGIVTNVSGSAAIAIQIPEDTFLPFSSGASLNDHSTLINLSADDHTQYVLLDGDRPNNSGTTSISGIYKAISGVFDSQVTISGIDVGDRLYTEAEVTALAEAFVEGGTADPASGVNVGAATEIYISGISVGNRLYTEAEVTTLAETFVEGGTADPVSGVNVGAAVQMWISGIPVGDRLYTEAEVTTLAETFIEGGTADPASGVNVGAATQMYISGIAVGDFMAAAAGADGSGIGRIIGSGSPTEITPSDLNILGSGGVAVLIQDTDTIVISGAAGGGGTPVDARAATGDIEPNASGTLQLGDAGLPWSSGWMNTLVLYDSNGVGWQLTVNTMGKLITTEL